MRAVELGEATLADLGLRRVVVRRLLDPFGRMVGYGRAVIHTGRVVEVRYPDPPNLYDVLVRLVRATALGDA